MKIEYNEKIYFKVFKNSYFPLCVTLCDDENEEDFI